MPNVQTPYVAEGILLAFMLFYTLLMLNLLACHSSSTSVPRNPSIHFFANECATWFIKALLLSPTALMMPCHTIQWWCIGRIRILLSVMWYIYLFQNANCGILKFQLLFQEWFVCSYIDNIINKSSSSSTTRSTGSTFVLWWFVLLFSRFVI